MSSAIMLEVPEELAARLNVHAGRLPQILELGLREFTAINQSGFQGVSQVLEFLAELPTPEEIIALRPSDSLQQRIQQLLVKNQENGLSDMEEREWQQYEYIEHLVRMAKARAQLRLSQR